MQPSAAANEAAKPKSNASLLALFLLGAVTLLYLFAGEEGGSGTDGKLQLFKTMFLSLLIEALPFILIGVVVSACCRCSCPTGSSGEPSRKTRCSPCLRQACSASSCRSANAGWCRLSAG